MLTFLLVVALAAAIAWGTREQSEAKRLKERLRPILDIEGYVRVAKQTADSSLAKAKNESERIVNSAEAERERIGRQASELQVERDLTDADLTALQEALRLKADDAHLLEVGYYEPVYGFEDLPKYTSRLEKIKEEQREMLRVGGETGSRSAAAFATEQLTYNGSEKNGRSLLKKVLQLMLRAFNGECDSFIARVNYRNVVTMQKRIRSSFDQINKLAATWNCMLSSRYLDNRLGELSLVYEYSELEQKIKEEQAAIRQQEREDEKARREAERRERDAANREAVAQKALEEAQTALGAATDRDAEEYRRKIADLERQLAEAREEKQRAKSLAEQTRAGYVYIFSNVGSFGDNVYKIGMTRREDPEDRRRELGDASVPFPFDCHAYIWTEDAPALERALHIHFDGRRLNLENPRKEFFRLNIDEIQKEIDELKITLGIDAEIRWTLLAEAKDYRMSEAKRKHLEASFRQPIVDSTGAKDDPSI
jgi:hypothetical protein